MVRSVTALAWTNLRRVPARSLLATTGLALASATFTVLLAIAVGFRGAVVGSVLGDAVAVEVRGADYAAACATLLLAGIGMANLTYLNIRDRSVELATLLSVGWSARRTQRLLATEGLMLGVIGGGAGAVMGYAVAWLLFGTLPVSVLLAAGVACLLGTAVSLLAAIFTSRRLDRLPLTLLLTE
jgi:ABC-type lipoprotein release transport system permease subunit